MVSGPSFGNGLLQYKLVNAKDAIKVNGTFPRTPPYIEECQHPEALNPSAVIGSVVICTFSAGFNNGTSDLLAVINTAKALGFMGFVLVANPSYGDFIAEPIPFSVPGIMIPRTSDAQVYMMNSRNTRIKVTNTRRLSERKFSSCRSYLDTMNSKHTEMMKGRL